MFLTHVDVMLLPLFSAIAVIVSSTNAVGISKK